VKPFRFLEEADAEFQEQIAYFDQQSTGLGDRFVADVEATVRNICEYPDSGSHLSRNVRKRVLRVFHYNILYLNEPEEVVVVAVAAHKRRPGYWRKRLRKQR
jgi:plasmid stabilization system protein ParE